ncbi:GNAT family N-acetyltransferase [Runella sp. CRIBMP]|uniref:GNAT family N-acetyltransferase n=1 Tax=Runella sp. CRIBMP TaxID=2683261 RepID=UPI0014131A4E|nr:GNAT family N-acetyltransferase [Runella sp. CRIBMP]NBB19273.1 GNAT family N-acetyltransferase [Runella sp. CRIBMP]
MKLKVQKTTLATIKPFRSLFLQENNFQIRYNACHERGWTDSYRFTLGQHTVGYGSLKGQEIPDRDTIFEFYLIPAYRKYAAAFLEELIKISKAVYLEYQSNDALLSSMAYEFARDINAQAILFEDHFVTDIQPPEVQFRLRRDDDPHVECSGTYVLEFEQKVVATGGIMLHYNVPFADVFMEVSENQREKGLGSYLIQELKRECYQQGRVPAARCALTNKASKAALLKAGFKVAGFMLLGTVKN